ncbi:hypothetical protein [Streptomyces tailanensis]|uniref:hypothetical protein n=1 Tax=Streptomyces tailanensis TaxID=2569858 RepID=UPI00155ABF26|nr:hypothetical protein [Streptomyces tailanensis]
MFRHEPVPTAHKEAAHLASAATAPPTPNNLKRVVTVSLIGTTIEWCDFFRMCSPRGTYSPSMKIADSILHSSSATRHIAPVGCALGHVPPCGVAAIKVKLQVAPPSARPAATAGLTARQATAAAVVEPAGPASMKAEPIPASQRRSVAGRAH